MTHFPSRVNSFFATKFCFLHNRLSIGIFPGFRTLFPALRPEICRATPVLREQERIPHKPLLPFAICAHPVFYRENQKTGKRLARHCTPKKGCCTRAMEQGMIQACIRNAEPLLQAIVQIPSPQGASGCFAPSPFWQRADSAGAHRAACAQAGSWDGKKSRSPSGRGSSPCRFAPLHQRAAWD